MVRNNPLNTCAHNQKCIHRSKNAVKMTESQLRIAKSKLRIARYKARYKVDAV